MAKIVVSDPPLTLKEIHAAVRGVVSLAAIRRAWKSAELRSTRLSNRRVSRLSWVEAWIDGRKERGQAEPTEGGSDDC